MAKRATAQPKKPPLRVVSKRSPKSAAQPPDPPGTNGPAVADRETFHYHVGIIRRQQDKVAAERKFLKDARRKASDAGINLGDLDLAMRMSEQEPETVQESIRRMAVYAHWMGLAPGVQADLFDVAAERQSEEDQAYQEGYVEGLEGKTALGDRYDAGNQIGQARLRGWRDGQDIILKRWGKQMDAANDTAPPAPQEPRTERARHIGPTEPVDPLDGDVWVPQPDGSGPAYVWNAEKEIWRDDTTGKTPEIKVPETVE